MSAHNEGCTAAQSYFILPSLPALLSQMSGLQGAEIELKSFSLNGWMASGTVLPLGQEWK